MEVIIFFAVVLGGAFGLVVIVEKVLNAWEPGRAQLGKSGNDYEQPPPDAEYEEHTGPFVGTTAWGGVMVESGDLSVVLILLPVLDDESREAVPRGSDTDVNIDALIAVPHPAGGNLWLDTVRERFDVDSGDAYVVGEDDSTQLESLPESLHFELIDVEPADGGVRVTWNEGRDALVVGRFLALDRLSEAPTPRRLAGSLHYDQNLEDDGANDVLMGLQRTDLLGNVLPANANSAEYDAMLDLAGISLTVDQPADYEKGRDFGTAWLQRRVTDGDWSALDRAQPLVHPACYGDLVVEMILDEDLDGAERVADFGAEHLDTPFFQFYRGLISLLRSQVDDAIEWFESAARGEPAMPEAWASLAATHLELGNDDKARSSAEAGLAELPEDPITVRASIQTLAQVGALERAVEVLEDYGAVLATGTRAALEEALENPDAFDDATVTHQFTGLAHYAVERALRSMTEENFAAAETLLRRALELDPDNLEAAADLGRCLSQMGREQDALDWYDEAIGELSFGRLLEYNRGNCLRRLGRYSDAIDSYEHCLELAPGWLEPRVNALGLYCMLAHRSNAEAHLAYLDEHAELEPEIMDELRDQVAAL